MKELSDLEICKAIASVEGYNAKIRKFNSSAYECGYHAHVYLKGNPNGAGFWTNVYSPTTDKALTFDLMIKYEIRLCKEYDGTWICFHNKSSEILSKDANPQRAICMAIINLQSL